MTRGAVVVALLLGFADPALAAAAPELERFEKWLNTGLPHANFKRVEDPERPGLLYAGRVGEFGTIVRVFVSNGKIVRQKIEVELPSERRDEIALSIIARFFRDFTGMRRNEEELWRQVQGMRSRIYRSGRKEASVDFLGARLSLYLDTQPNYDLIDPERKNWGTLFWRGEAKRLPPRKK
jgi:hypothetical protein